jgi:hypothetical protein
MHLLSVTLVNKPVLFVLDTFNYMKDTANLMYCDRFAQGIAGQQPGGHILTHAPRNNSVEVFPSCPRMGRAIQHMRGDVTQQSRSRGTPCDITVETVFPVMRICATAI